MKVNPSIEVQQNYYNSYWENRPRTLNAHELYRLSAIFDGLGVVIEDARLRKINLLICDFGSGWGWLSNFLSYMGKVVGVELSEEATTVAQRKFPDVEFICADITQWRPVQTFDLVVSSEVIEHVPDKIAFFKTIDTILRPGGWVILTTPNKSVKKEWDKQNGQGQIIEDWCSVPEIRHFYRSYKVSTHHTFLNDFSYTGIFRILSAPKLLRTLQLFKLLDIYNSLRTRFNLGLYQIIVAQKPMEL